MVSDTLEPLAKSSGTIDYLYELNHLASDVYNHSLRVAILAGVIAKWMHFDKAKTTDIMLAGFLHDIGKPNFPNDCWKKMLPNCKVMIMRPIFSIPLMVIIS